MYNIQVETEKRFSLILFFILPIVSFIYSVINFKNKNQRFYLLLFAFLYGFTFIPIENSDGATYKDRFGKITEYSFEEYVNNLISITEVESRYNDIYIYTLFYFLNLFSSDYRIFFLVVSIIYFSLFFSLLSKIFDSTKNNISTKPVFWFFFGFVFIFNISAGLNGIRWPLAAMIIFYNAFLLVETNKFKYLIFASASILVHFASIYPIIFLVFYYLIHRINSRFIGVTFILFIVSSQVIFTEFVTSNLNKLNPAYEARTSSYISNTDYQSQRNEHVGKWNWYVQVNFYFKQYFVPIVLLILFLFSRRMKFDSFLNKFLVLILLFYGASLISGALLDEISNRYTVFPYGLLLIFLFILSSKNEGSSIIKIIKFGFIPFFILDFLVTMRADLYTMSPILFFGNPISIFFIDFEKSIQTILLGG